MDISFRMCFWDMRMATLATVLPFPNCWCGAISEQGMGIVGAELCLWGMFGPGVVLGAIPQTAPIALASRGHWETCARDQSLHWCTP